MIIGHQKQWDFLKRAAETGEFSHAYLFSGQEKLGKKKIALEMISMLFGQDLSKTQHPDLISIEPQAKEIQISQIRDLIWKLSLKPYSAPLKVAVIDQAHLMNQEAQTCLLKTLEEPKGKAILFLITSLPQYFFPTILSRVQSIKFYQVGDEEIRAYLRGQKIPERELEEIVKMSLGRPGVALDLLSDNQKIKSFKGKLKKLDNLSASGVGVRFKYAKELADNPQEVNETLDVWEIYFRDSLIGSIGKKDNKKLIKILKSIEQVKFLISRTNVNLRLALENLMLEF